MKEEELMKIILAIQSATANAGLEVSPDSLLTNAMNYYMFNEKKESAPVQSQQQYDPNKASPKQIGMLKRLGFKGNFNEITKKEASQVISELMAKKEKGGNQEDVAYEGDY